MVWKKHWSPLLTQFPFHSPSLKFSSSDTALGSGVIPGESCAISRATASCPITHPEPLFAVRHDAILPLVGSAGEVGQIDHDGLASFGLASDPVDAAGSLFDGARIPCEIMVNHMAAEPLQVDAFEEAKSASR